MTERPILFSGPMVRALLDGTKTQTRRVVKPQPVSVGYQPLVSFNHGRPEVSFGKEDQDARGLRWWRCPYGQVGDRLWVRETWGLNDSDHGGKKPIPKVRPVDLPAEALVFYASEDDPEIRNELRWRPSIHMPRWASRLTLEITDIRVERLHDISETDAMAEGIHRIWPEGHISDDGPNHYTINVGVFNANAPTAAKVYRMLWEWINGPDSWNTNPWVWAITFEVVQ